MIDLFSKKNKILKFIENGDSENLSSILNKISDINEKFSRPDNKDEKKWTYLFHTCKYGNSEILQLLLNNEFEINIKDSDGKAPLYWAACNVEDDEAAKIVNNLIEKGVDVNEKTNTNRTALQGAVINSNVMAMEALIGAGADPNLQDEEGLSALFIAASRSAEAVKMLLEHKADPNIENMNKATPIFESASTDDIEIISALVVGGADINHKIETPDGELYALDVAIGEENQTVATYLLTKGAKYNHDMSDVEVMMHANEEQASAHKEMADEEGKYHYELHFKELNDDQISEMKEMFEDYTWDMGLAVSKFDYKKDGKTFKILFDSKKYFDMQKDESGEDWDDKDLAQNIVTRLLGKEQFFCGLWSTGNFEDKEVVFVDDENNKWEVTIDKYGGLEKIT